MANNSAGMELSSGAPHDYPTFDTVVMCMKIILILIAICGNCLTIAAISRCKSLRYPSNIMIAALAVSDLLTVTVYTPLVMLQTKMPVLFKTRTSCLTTIFIGVFVLVSNVVFLSLLSTERFYAVQFPFHYHKTVTMKFNFIWCMTAVVGILILIIPTISGIDRWSQVDRCYSPRLFSRLYSRLFACVLLTVQIVGLISLFRVLVAQLKFRMRERNQHVSEVEKQASLQSTVMVLAYGVSVCLYLPHLFYFLWRIGSEDKQYHVHLIQETLLVLDSCNPAVNTFIYGFKNSKFREAYRILLGWKGMRVRPLPLTAGTNEIA